MHDIILITGVPGSGKSTTALFLAQKIDRSVLLSGDGLRELVVGGFVSPAEEWTAEHHKQFLASFQNEALLAKNFIAQGFKVIIEDVINPNIGLWEEWQKCFVGMNYKQVLLVPTLEAALERNTTRGKSLPDEVIRSLYEDMTAGSLSGWPVIDNSTKTLEETAKEIAQIAGWEI